MDCVSDEIKSSPHFEDNVCIPKSFAKLIGYNATKLRSRVTRFGRICAPWAVFSILSF
jgi:hypothetical protein